jgi:serine protease Do
MASSLTAGMPADSRRQEFIGTVGQGALRRPIVDCRRLSKGFSVLTQKRNFRGALLASALGASLVLPSFAPYSWAQTQNLTQQTQQQTQQALPSLSPIIQKVMPAVVSVSVTMRGDAAMSGDDEETGPDNQSDNGNGPGPNFPQSPFDQLLKRFFEQQGRGGMPQPQIGKRVALGSGFIIDPQGYIVTNNHVAGEAGTVTVSFQDDTKHPAKIVGRDAMTDLALLKIDTDKPLPFVTWGDSDAAKIGDWILAIGNPFGLGGTVTTGIISARGRDIHSGPFDDFLQLDAAINRGNSGGPTFTQQGQVIGINTAIYSPNGGSVGIGFAIPSNLAKTVIAQLREHGKVDRGWLGIQIQQMTPEIASSLGLPGEHGALVSDVMADSPAARAGVKQGDVIVKFNRHEIDKLHDLPRLVAETPIHSKVDIAVWRGGRNEQLQADVGQMPDDKQEVASNNREQQPSGSQRSSTLGLQLRQLDSSTRKQLGLKGEVKGVVVTQVAPDSPAADIGVQPGDVIVAINQQKVTTPEEAAQRLKRAEQNGDKHLLLLLNRHGVNGYIGLSVG